MEVEKQSQRLNWFYGLTMPALFLIVMWGIYWLEKSQGLEWYEYGMLPREISGLKGIVTMHFLHGDFEHIWGNSVALAVLMWGLFFHYRKIAFKVLLLTMFMTGAYLWLFGNPNYHIGASGLIYGLNAFLILSGFLRKQKELIGLSLVVVFLYGGLVWYAFPVDPKISWQGHLFGLVAGVMLAIYYRKKGPRRKLYQWEIDEIREEEWLKAMEAQRNMPVNEPPVYHGPIRIVYEYKPASPTKEGDQKPPSPQ